VLENAIELTPSPDATAAVEFITGQTAPAQDLIPHVESATAVFKSIAIEKVRPVRPGAASQDSR
jgi:hypothetical protein